MDLGHYNCRDYVQGPHFAATTLTSETHLREPPTLHRHESWAELEHRSRSPASLKPKFPLLKLPLELRQQVLLYLLPRTKEGVESDPLARHARMFSAVQKRGAEGMAVPTEEGLAARHARVSTSNVVWIRGNISLFRVCRQLHDECAALVYGRNTFLLFLTYADIKWRYRWLLPSGQAPSRNYPFLELLPERYMRLLKRVVVHVDHVDAYTGMIKWNVSGKGLTFGLRRQVQRLVNALKPVAGEEGAMEGGEKRYLTHLTIRVSNSAVSDTMPRRQCGSPAKPSNSDAAADDLETLLQPFRQLYECRNASVSGAVTASFACELEACLRSPRPTITEGAFDVDDAGGLAAPLPGLCVYGNDL